MHFRKTIQRIAPALVLGLVFVVAAALGCAKKAPVTADSSGLRPAGSESDTANGNAAAADENGPGGAENGNDGAASRGLGGAKPPSPAADPSTQIPHGSAADVAEHLNKLNAQFQALIETADTIPPLPEARNKFRQQVEKLLDARMKAAEKILEDEKAEAEHRRLAMHAMFESLDSLDSMGDRSAGERLLALARSAEEDADDTVRRLAAAVLFEEELEGLEEGNSEAAAEVVEKLKFVLGGPPQELSIPQFVLAQNTARALLQTRHTAQGAAVLRLIGERFADVPHAQLAEAAEELASQAVIIELDYGMRRLLANEEGAKEDLVDAAKALGGAEEVDLRGLRVLAVVAEEIKDEHPDAAQSINAAVRQGVGTLLAGEPLSPGELMVVMDLADTLGEEHGDVVEAASGKITDAVSLAIADAAADGDLAESLADLLREVAQQAEHRGRIELAEAVYGAIGGALAQVNDPREAGALEIEVASAKRRLGLIGKPLAVEGVLLDGEPFDWAAYKGKVVLVDFWASWCRPCLEEFPNILDNYEKYHERGFEVVGVNVDDDIESVQRLFSARGELPWATVVSAEPEERGLKSPLAVECGVTAIPFVVLLGRDGKVLAIHVRGEELGEKLAELLGEPAPAGDEDPPAEPGDTDAPPEEAPRD